MLVVRFHSLRFPCLVGEGSEQRDEAELAFPALKSTSRLAQASPSCNRSCHGANISTNEVGMTAELVLCFVMGMWWFVYVKFDTSFKFCPLSREPFVLVHLR